MNRKLSYLATLGLALTFAFTAKVNAMSEEEKAILNTHTVTIETAFQSLASGGKVEFKAIWKALNELRQIFPMWRARGVNTIEKMQAAASTFFRLDTEVEEEGEEEEGSSTSVNPTNKLKKALHDLFILTSRQLSYSKYLQTSYKLMVKAVNKTNVKSFKDQSKKLQETFGSDIAGIDNLERLLLQISKCYSHKIRVDDYKTKSNIEEVEEKIQNLHKKLFITMEKSDWEDQVIMEENERIFLVSVLANSSKK